MIHAAAGGVGTVWVRLRKAAKAEVHGTASPQKHQRCRSSEIRAIADGWWWIGLHVAWRSFGGTAAAVLHCCAWVEGWHGFRIMQHGEKRDRCAGCGFPVLSMLRGF